MPFQNLNQFILNAIKEVTVCTSIKTGVIIRFPLVIFRTGNFDIILCENVLKHLNDEHSFVVSINLIFQTNHLTGHVQHP